MLSSSSRSGFSGVGTRRRQGLRTASQTAGRHGSRSDGSVDRHGRDQQRQASGATARGRLLLAVDSLGAKHEPCLQASLDAAALIDTAQGVFRLAEAQLHAVDLQLEPAHRQTHPPSYLAAPGLREDGARVRDVDSQVRGGGMVL